MPWTASAGSAGVGVIQLAIRCVGSNGIVDSIELTRNAADTLGTAWVRTTAPFNIRAYLTTVKSGAFAEPAMLNNRVTPSSSQPVLISIPMPPRGAQDKVKEIAAVEALRLSLKKELKRAKLKRELDTVDARKDAGVQKAQRDYKAVERKLYQQLLAAMYRHEEKIFQSRLAAVKADADARRYDFDTEQQKSREALDDDFAFLERFLNGKIAEEKAAQKATGSVSVDGSLELGRNFTAKVLSQAWTGSAAAGFSEGEWRGWTASPSVSFRRERQADPAGMELIPGDPTAGLPVAAQPDRDTLTGRLAAGLRWESAVGGRPMRLRHQARLTGGVEERFAGGRRTLFPFLGFQLTATALVSY